MMSPWTREVRSRSIEIDAGKTRLSGVLAIPADALGIVIFAHGSGSSRKSPRNRMVADVLVNAGLATLLLDLLTPEEAELERAGAMLRFDVDRLAARLVAACDEIAAEPDTRALPIGLFGASTGAAAALIAAAQRPALVRAVVSRGGRPDLAGQWLGLVRAPTLLIVGGDDEQVIPLNRTALDRLSCEKKLRIVSGATHLFEEPGALESVARSSTQWFLRHLSDGAAAADSHD